MVYGCLRSLEPFISGTSAFNSRKPKVTVPLAQFQAEVERNSWEGIASTSLSRPGRSPTANM